MDFTICPDCAAIAEIQERRVLESTDGPVEHARVRCLNRHWFLLPVAHLAAAAAARSTWQPVASAG